MGPQQFLQLGEKLLGIKEFPDLSSEQGDNIPLVDGSSKVIAQPFNGDAQRTLEDRGEGFVWLDLPSQHWMYLGMCLGVDAPAGRPAAARATLPAAATLAEKNTTQAGCIGETSAGRWKPLLE
jgi:hypothetical protein